MHENRPMHDVGWVTREMTTISSAYYNCISCYMYIKRILSLDGAIFYNGRLMPRVTNASESKCNKCC